MTPLEIVRAVYEAFGRRDALTVFSLFSPDIEIIQSQALPWGGSYRGHEQARQFFAKLTARINSTVTIDRLLDAGEHVVAIGWTEGTVNATGAAYRVPIAHVWKVRDASVVRVHFLIDNPTMLSALASGQPPPAAAATARS